MSGIFADLELHPNELELARQARAAGAGYLDLTSSNPTQQGLLFPAEVLAAAAAPYWATRRYTPDPRGGLAARMAIREAYAQRTPALHLDHDDIFLTASTSEAYSLLFALLADPGDNLLAPNVTYPLFEYLAALRGVELRSYPLDEARGWAIDEHAILRAADARTRAVLLISPHNPTGAVITEPVAALNTLGLPLISDEVFAPFALGVTYVPPVAALHPNIPVFTLDGISKRFALPDLKLGWVALNAAARNWSARLELVNDTFLGANGLIQQMVPDLFHQGGNFTNTMVARVRANMQLALERFAGHQRVHARMPAGGYYLFPAITGWPDEEALVLYLLEQGVLVHPGYFYGDVPGTHLMLSALTEPTVFAAGVARLAEALR